MADEVYFMTRQVYIMTGEGDVITGEVYKVSWEGYLQTVDDKFSGVRLMLWRVRFLLGPVREMF